MKQFQFLLLLLVVCCLGYGVAEKVINCYIATWANYRPGDGKFEPENVDAKLCTHLSYSFFGITEMGEFRSLDTHLDIKLGYINRCMALKKINPKLKVLATVGGWNEGSANYSAMAGDQQKRMRFIQTSIEFMQQHKFDGLNLDWEYPAQRGGLAEDKQNLVVLLEEMKKAFTPLKLELNIAVGAAGSTLETSYDMPNITKHVDHVHVMTYDYCMSTSRILCLNAPLNGQGDNNVETSVKLYLDSGVPANKLILGLAFYGDSFQLANVQETAPGSRTTGPSPAGPFTGMNGTLGYNEICPMIPSWTSVFDSTHGIPYMYKGNQWIDYDDVKSLNLKLDYLNSLKLGGALVWSIDTDDFRGKCAGGEKFPLLKAVHRKLTSGKLPNSATSYKVYSLGMFYFILFSIIKCFI